MLVTSALAVVIAASSPLHAVEQVDVAFEEISAGENAAAIERIEANSALANDDPTRLINLGVAYANHGEVQKARKFFRTALYSQDRQLVETSEGEWVDSRTLARRALARLDEADATGYAQVAFAHSE